MEESFFVVVVAHHLTHTHRIPRTTTDDGSIGQDSIAERSDLRSKHSRDRIFTKIS